MFKIRLKIQNIGIIAEADIKIEGVTVIAGANSSGKSTIGRVLYAIGTSLSESSSLNLFKQKLTNLSSQLNSMKKFSFDPGSLNLLEEAITLVGETSYTLSIMEKQPIVLKDIKNHDENFNNRISSILLELKRRIKEDSKKNTRERNRFEVLIKTHTIYEIIEVIKTDIFKEDKLKFQMLQSVFDSEFHSQISNLTSKNLKSTIFFEEVNHNFGELVFIEDILEKSDSVININRDFSRPIFIDDPTVIDEISEADRNYIMNSKSVYNHKNYLIDLLKQTNLDENIFSKNTKEKLIDSILREIINGNIFINGRKSFYELPNSDRNSKLSLSNLSTGMKSFSILTILKNSGVFDNIEYVILDEPEIHLHPEWQLKYAELIILLSKYLNIKFLVTSHSPYFIESIELFSKQHGISQKTNYYKSNMTSNPNFYIIEDYTKKLDIIYDELAAPLYSLQELRDRLEEE